MTNPTVKLFITYKTKKPIIKSDIIVPIQTGRAISNEKFEGMIGDDTGENISELNENFCENSAIYWTWKNYDKIGNPDYIGFMHYRRHFLFNPEKYRDAPPLINAECFNGQYFQECNFNYTNVSNILNHCDCIFPKPMQLVEKNVYEQYINYSYKKDYDLAMEILSQKYPQDIPYMERYNNSQFAFFFNMFVMKKEIFFDYCSWLYDILLELHSKIDTTGYDDYQKRQVSFISERLTGIYITKLITENPQGRFLALPVTFVQNTESPTLKNHVNYTRYKLKEKLAKNAEKAKHYKHKAEIEKSIIDNNKLT